MSSVRQSSSGAAADLLRRAAAVASLLLTDWVALLVCVTLAWLLRAKLLEGLSPGIGPVDPLSTFLYGQYFFLPWTFAFAQRGLYTRRLSAWDDVRLCIRATSFGAALSIVLSYAGRPELALSRVVIGLTWLSSLVLIPLARQVTKRLLARAGWLRKRIVIVGAGSTGRDVYQHLTADRVLGYETAAFIDDDALLIGQQINGIPIVGPLDELPAHIVALGVKDLVIASPQLPRQRLLRLIESCEGLIESIRLVPDLVGLATVGVEAEDVNGTLLLHLRRNLAKPWNSAIKRAFDVSLSLTIGAIVAPIVAVLAVAIRLDSPGPAFYGQTRLGRRRREFVCMKLRTMRIGSDASLTAHLANDEQANRDWAQFAKLKVDDPRLTRSGRVLRRWSLDELPQLWNVIKGEMSLVGPRPYLGAELDRMGAAADTVLRARPGLTGLWQVSGRNELPFEQRVLLDEYYVRNWSLWMDAMILVRTLGAVLRGRGAY